MFKTAVTLLVLIILSGCMDVIEPQISRLPDPSPIQPQARQEPEPEPEPEIITPRFGGALRLSMRSQQHFNPLLNEDVTVARALQLLFEPLITFDDELRFRPNLATLEFAFNGASVVVTIREDALWSDGSPITSDDLIFSVETLRNAPPGAIYRHNIENFDALEILDERTVRITFRTIMGGAAYLFNFPIIPRHGNNMAPIGSGPFMFESYINSESVTFVRNPYTFRSRPYIEEVHILITSDDETDLHAFDRGLVDIFLAEVPAWHRHHSVKPVRFAEHLAMHYEFIGFNFAHELPGTLEFRQAIAHAINVDNLISNVFLAHAMPARTAIHPASWLYTPSAPVYVHNIEMAETLAAYVISNIYWPTDEENERLPLTVLVNEENIERAHIARVLVNQMNEIGLYAEVVSLPFDDFLQQLQNGNFDMFVGGYKLSLQPNISFAFHSESPDNLLSLNDPEMDRLLDTANVSGTDSMFLRTLEDIQQHMARELPVISLAFRHSAVVADRRIMGDMRPTVDNIFANVEYWFLFKED